MGAAQSFATLAGWLAIALLLLSRSAGATPEPPPAASAVLLGTVKQQGNRDPLPALELSLTVGSQPPLRAITDDEGRFELPAVAPGPAVVRIRGTAIVPTEIKESLRPGRIEVIYYVARKSRSFETQVRAQSARREVIETTLTSDEIKHIAGGQNDVVKAVQNLPGVARAPFGIGQLIVWGAAPNDTRAYADGVYIPRVYHFGGLRSTIAADFISELRFTPGVYGADYGRGLGGIVEIATRAPKSDRLHGSVTLDLIDGGITVEGPISKKLHIAIGARISWLAAFLPLFNKSPTQLSPFYWDYQLALRYQASAHDDLDLFIFGATSNVTAKVDDPDPSARVDINSKSYFGRARLRLTHRFSKDSTLSVMPSVGGDTFSVDTGALGIGGTPVRLHVLSFGYSLRSELRQRLRSFFNYAVGLDFEGTYAQVETLQPSGPAGGYGSNLPVGGGGLVTAAGSMTSGGFLGSGLLSDSSGAAVLEQLNYHLVSTAPYLITNILLFGDRLALSPQLRATVDYLSLASAGPTPQPASTRLFFEPRLGVRLALVSQRLWLVGGLGSYHQAPQGAELSPRFGNPHLLWQSGTTYAAGFEANLIQGLHLEAQGFYKDLRQLVVADPYLNNSNDGLGRVYGGELLLRQPLWHGLSGWVAYTLSRSQRRDHPDEPWRLYQFDQTHILTLITSYQLPRGFTLGLRFRYVTGNPTTPYLGGLRDVGYQDYTAILGEPNSVRLPDFHQLDLRVDKDIVFHRWRLGLYLEVQNIYNRKNAESLIYGGRQMFQGGKVSGLPIFPNLGVRADF